MPTTLPIFFKSDEFSNLELAGVIPPLSENSTRDVTFFTINAIAPYYEGEREYTSIFSNGQEFICALTHKQVMGRMATRSVVVQGLN